jgi:hypothetical protein
VNLSDTEWEDTPDAAALGAALVDQALLVATARRQLQARLEKAADAALAAALDGTTDPNAPVVPGMDDAVAQALRELEADQLEQAAIAAGAELNAAADQAAADDEPQLYYGSLPEFVERFLVRAYRREIPARRTWCKEWWKHPEVTARLDALWRSWEALRLDPATGMSVWWRDHADHHMARILDVDGPFKGCTTEKHGANGSPLKPLPLDDPTEGLYDGQAG